MTCFPLTTEDKGVETYLLTFSFSSSRDGSYSVLKIPGLEESRVKTSTPPFFFFPTKPEVRLGYSPVKNSLSSLATGKVVGWKFRLVKVGM